jgi:glycosyltransferase involved in cell wall biosynthesis
MIEERKGFKHIARAVARVAEGHELTWHIVGEGPLRDDVTEAVERLQLGENVTVHGFIDDSMLKRLYKRCSLLILPSDWEGHPLVLLEAWASGDLVIGTDVEGIREFLADGYGELVPVNDPEALGRAVITYFSKTETIKMIGTEAQSFVRSEYSWDSTVAQTYRVYEELLNKRNPK